ncbi:hypothetical protein [Streptomyces caniscabiei]|uniref:Uncharacterized protein n=1 Tax=Streptomyces caniscabiei TaxID=2746961 RepID=A0A927L0Y6_9ACTN|nr:hypothetical protein [Streptomyces caniscabiei]MBD9723397.1 hypothetical protein [Streptomyces caniscabiei]MDX3512078.1 hypothetical protein [Streptomyces caniscabiei]MDX3718868.1 hypothetical protein [Streptomyces caniscabiei]WEO26971.1 hypothetical protein IHE65_29560 [Streptomyces caniscabiei]
MDLEKRPARQQQTEARRTPAEAQQAPEGCLVVAIRIPVRIVVLVLVVPVRMVWDALVVGGRVLLDTVLRPAGRAVLWVGRAVLVWPCVALWRYVVVPLAQLLGWLGHRLLVVPAVWTYRYVLTPVGHAIAWAAAGVLAGCGWVAQGVLAMLLWLYRWTVVPVGRSVAWLVRHLLVVPAVWLYRYVLTPVGHAIRWVALGGVWLVRMIFTGLWLGIYWTLRVLLVMPALALWRWVLAPVGRLVAVVGREIGAALGHAWRVAGRISLAVGRFLANLFRLLLVEPARWVYRTVLTPAGHFARDMVGKPLAAAGRAVGRATRQALATARETVRQARAGVRAALFGRPTESKPVHRREPTGAEARTLGRSTTALTKD